MMDEDLGSAIGGLIGGALEGRTDSTLVPVRVATSCREDSAAAIAEAIRDLVTAFHERNDCHASSVRVVLFTATADLRASKPASAARAAGWNAAQYLCLAEMPTDDDIARCIRGLLFVERHRAAAALQPVYRNGTHVLRPDIAMS